MKSSFLPHIRNIFLITVRLLWGPYQVAKLQKHRKAGLEGIPYNEAQSERFYSTTPLDKMEAHAGPWEKLIVAYALKESYSALPPQSVPSKGHWKDRSLMNNH